MGKEITSISIDGNLKLKAKQLNIKLSSLVNQILLGIISQYDDSDFDMYQLESDLEEIRNKIGELKIQENELLTKKIAFQEKLRQESDEATKRGEKMADALRASGKWR